MLLQTAINGQPYHFKITPFTDKEQKRLMYHIQISDNEYTVVERYHGVWFQIEGNALLPEKQNAIFDALDELDVSLLMAELKTDLMLF